MKSLKVYFLLSNTLQLLLCILTLTFLEYKGPTFQLTRKMVEGLAKCRWPGRTQVLNYSHDLTYYLDGAHTSESMHNCVVWYRNAVPVLSTS